MNILLLGATGRVGSGILSLALQDGHAVTLLVRTPEKITRKDGLLTILQGNALNEEDLALASRGIDVVVSALSTDGTTTLSGSIPLIIAAMHREGIKRIITVGTAGILQSRTEPGRLRYQSSESKRRLTRAAEEHHKVYELLNASDLDWTIVCPSYLPDGGSTGIFRAEPDYLPEGGTQLSVGDAALFTYRQIATKDYIRSRVGVVY
ncbi:MULTISPECIES: NAD(P)-dependent oxidoreductase [Paenibacillus]|uniref:NAD(P)-dependent oxidoreductase n=1 Tax=Paenibacillus TaxID=44249 RepID=UPI0022B91AC9|nr:SDR family oxidoreductase [Paenibacillus caseinilyticus]MCZ8517882.1 SDR family oxidoreductase [Paenibacillus caseinilyticus]